MAPKLFITGSTGYIGGSVLSTLVKHHPEYAITALLRKEPSNFKSMYPNIRVVKGDYDSTEILTQAARDADVVVHCGDSDHEPSLRALIAGLLKGSPSPGFLIHLSGTGIVSDWSEREWQGRLNPKVWSDIDDLDAVSSRSDINLHRNTEKIIFAAAAEHGEQLKTAIMCPPDIYGSGTGPGKVRSVYFPVYFEQAKKLGYAFYAGEGTNTRSWVHVEDLMKVYLRLVEAAVAGGEGANWGKEGYYFTASQEVSQIDVAKAVGKLMHSRGLIGEAEPKSLSVDEVNGLVQHPRFPMLGKYLFASNSRTLPRRAEKCFGYAPSAPSLWDSLEADLDAWIKEG